MTEIQVEQGSAEWLKMRLGKITGTRLSDVYKTDNLALVDELIAEIITENVDDTFQSKSMYHGKENEPFAKMIYQQAKEIEIEEVGFCLAEWHDYLALSPDGFTPCRTGAIEIKCPNTKTHVKYIRQGQLPNEYKYQVYTYFLVNPKLEWLDFISYDYRFKPRPMFVKRIKRDDILTELAEAKSGLEKFTAKFEKYYKQVTN